jgi:hypothetical protein
MVHLSAITGSFIEALVNRIANQRGFAGSPSAQFQMDEPGSSRH